MTTTRWFTCPCCGKPAETDRTDIEPVQVHSDCPPSWFPVLRPGTERHVDQRLVCSECYTAAGADRAAAARVNPEDPPHPFGQRFHAEVRLSNPVGSRNPFVVK